MWCGMVGSGKTYNAIADILKDAGDNIYAPPNLINIDEVNKYVDKEVTDGEYVQMYRMADGTYGLGKKNLIEWKDFSDEEAVNAHCGVLFLDEAPMWLDARKFDVLSPEARRKLLEHRKDDILIISTAQDVALIDKIFRLICDEIRVVRQQGLPFIGWIWPLSVRPTIVCKNCGRVRRDGSGDDRGWKKIFGFGTMYMWNTFKAKDLIDAQDTTGEQIEPKKIGSGFRLFNQRVAACYDTSLKLSNVAETALASRRALKRTTRRSPEEIEERKRLPEEQEIVGSPLLPV